MNDLHFNNCYFMLGGIDYCKKNIGNKEKL